MKKNRIPPFVLTIFGSLTVFLIIFYLMTGDPSSIGVSNQGIYNVIVVGGIIVSMLLVLLVINLLFSKKIEKNYK